MPAGTVPGHSSEMRSSISATVIAAAVVVGAAVVVRGIVVVVAAVVGGAFVVATVVAGVVSIDIVPATGSSSAPDPQADSTKLRAA
jgi:hypothetical protein